MDAGDMSNITCHPCVPLASPKIDVDLKITFGSKPIHNDLS